MRIGVPGDPGLTSLLTGDEGGNLILPAAWKRKLTAGSARTTPRNNIRAGVGFLLMRMARYTHRSEPGADAEIRQWVVKPGDSLARIAKTQGSTIDELKKLNPSITVLQPGRTLKYRRASVQRVISGWRVISTTSIAQFYNGGRDPSYAKKLDYALSLIRTQGTTSCTR